MVIPETEMNEVLCKEREATLHQDSSNPETLNELGLFFAQKKQFGKAKECFVKALESTPDVPQLHNNLAKTFKHLENFEAAEQHYQKAITLNSHYIESYNNLGCLYQQQKKYNEATFLYRKAIALNPNFLEARLNLGSLYLIQNKLTKSLQVFEEILRRFGDNSIAHTQLGHLYWQQNNFARARMHYENVVRHKKISLDVLNNLGAMALYEENYIQANDYFEKVLSKFPEHVNARSNLASSLLKQRKFKESIHHFLLYLKLEPQDAQAFYNVSLAFFLSGQFTQAEIYLKQCLLYESNYIPALINLAAISLKKEQKSEAIIIYQKIKGLHPQEEIANYMLHALLGLGKPKRAPIQYVKNLFDYYADDFDQHVTSTLKYQTPSLLRNRLAFFLKTPLPLAIDIGCGTGLSGEAFRDCADKWIGIDISSQMLKKAQKKGIYDELIEGFLPEIIDTLCLQSPLIISVDTLVYFGELSSFFNAIEKILTSGGYLAFSLELGDFSPYQLQTTGRFQHRIDYVKKIADEMSFQMKDFYEISGRVQAGKPVITGLFILQKL